MQQTPPRPATRLRTIGVTLAGIALLWAAGAFGLHALRNHAPDNLREIASPDGRYRLVITEDLAGFPGQVCMGDVYALGAGTALDRTDENARVFNGACDGLLDIHWVGSQVEGTVDLKAATDRVTGVTLRGSGANGRVRVNWLAGHRG